MDNELATSSMLRLVALKGATTIPLDKGVQVDFFPFVTFSVPLDDFRAKSSSAVQVFKMVQVSFHFPTLSYSTLVCYPILAWQCKTASA